MILDFISIIGIGIVIPLTVVISVKVLKGSNRQTELCNEIKQKYGIDQPTFQDHDLTSAHRNNYLFNYFSEKSKKNSNGFMNFEDARINLANNPKGHNIKCALGHEKKCICSCGGSLHGILSHE